MKSTQKTSAAIFFSVTVMLIGVQVLLYGGDSSRNCKLVTPEEVSKVVGKPIIKTGDSALGCAYIPKKSNLSHFTVYVTDKDADLFDTFRKPRPDVTIQPLNGIGDKAALAIRRGKVFDAIVISGKWSVRFNFTFANVKLDTPKYDHLIKLLKTAADRL
jgi:hypothetical protein